MKERMQNNKTEEAESTMTERMKHNDKEDVVQ